MDTIFMNSENSQKCKPYVLILKLTDLRRGEKRFVLSSLSIYYIWKNIKSTCKKNKFKISARRWNDEFKLPDGSYLISDIQDYFECLLKSH